MQGMFVVLIPGGRDARLDLMVLRIIHQRHDFTTAPFFQSD